MDRQSPTRSGRHLREGSLQQDGHGETRGKAGDFDHLDDVVDDGYTEICLGLTGSTTGYDVARKNYMKNIVEPRSDMEFSDEQIVEGADAVTIRQHVKATHSGEFLGVSPTGRRIEWNAITIVNVKDDRVVGQWAQPDLYGIHQQLIACPPYLGASRVLAS